jgi:hypothetical protein
VVEEPEAGEPGVTETVDVATPGGRGGLPEPPVTGDPAVDDAVGRLVDLTALGLDDHPQLYEGVHRILTDRLADLEG